MQGASSACAEPSTAGDDHREGIREAGSRDGVAGLREILRSSSSSSPDSQLLEIQIDRLSQVAAARSHVGQVQGGLSLLEAW